MNSGLFVSERYQKGTQPLNMKLKENVMKRALYLKHLACSNRFRVETQELRDSILLKIFGDLQEEVDNFINLSCINDLTLF